MEAAEVQDNSFLEEPGSGRATAVPDDQKDPHLLYGPVEAQWVLNVLDDTLQKLRVCTYLTPNILRDKMIDACDTELIVALKEHFGIEEEYEGVLQKLEEANKIEGDGIVDERKQEYEELMADIDACLADSTRTVCRLLTGESHNLIVQNRLKELTTVSSPSVLEYINTFVKLRNLIHTKLGTTAEEESATRQQTQDLAKKEKEDNDKYKELLAKLQQEQKDHKEQLTKKDQKISRLEAQISQLEEETSQRRFEIKMRSEREDQDAKAVFESTKQQLEAVLKDAETRLAEKGKFNFDSENAAHRKLDLQGEQVEQTIQRYDDEMRQQRDELTSLETQYEEETNYLKRLKLHFDLFETENKRIEDEMKYIREKRNAALLKERKRNHASVMVQALFKGFVVREKKEAKRAAKKAREEEGGGKKKR